MMMVRSWSSAAANSPLVLLSKINGWNWCWVTKLCHFLWYLRNCLTNCWVTFSRSASIFVLNFLTELLKQNFFFERIFITGKISRTLTQSRCRVLPKLTLSVCNTRLLTILTKNWYWNGPIGVEITDSPQP